MQYTISNNQLTITNTPNLSGVTLDGIIFYTGGINRPGMENGYIEQKSDMIEINTGKPGQTITFDIPSEVDQSALERAMDRARVRTGGMSQEDFDLKYLKGEQ